MTEKVDYYDLFSTVILGTLLVVWVPLFFPDLLLLKQPDYPEAFAVIALTAFSIFMGQLIQALASLSEPLLFRTFGGRPSAVALTKGLGRYLPLETAARIQTKLQSYVGEQASDVSLFLFASQRTDSAGVGRAPRFNSIYAYHRGLVILLLIMIGVVLASMCCGVAAAWSTSRNVAILVGLLALLVLVWYRARQRAFYYVREVLLTVERVLDEKSTPVSGSTS